MLSLVLVLAALVAGIVKVATRPRGALARAAETAIPPETQPRENAQDDRMVEAPTQLRPSAARHPRLPLVERQVGGPGIATLHGHVRSTAPLEEPIDAGALVVTASDRTRTVTLHAGSDGSFSMHVPPGTYLLTASLGTRVAVRENVVARAGTDSEVDLELHEGAAITGRTHGGGDLDVVVTAAPTGDRRGSEELASLEGNAFSVNGLVAGRRYDLTFTGERIRTVTVPGIMAPAEDVNVTLAPLAILRGAIGFARGETCPIDEVRLVGTNAVAGPHGSQDERTGRDDAMGTDEPGVTAATPDGACIFELPVPAGITQANVIATGSGWRLEEPVAIPPAGDPASLCLNPPCAPVSEVAGNVSVEVEGVPRHSGITAELSPGQAMCVSTDSSCDFDRVAIGTAVDVWASSDHCRTDVQHVIVAAGENVVRLRCRPVPDSPPVIDVSGGFARADGQGSGEEAGGESPGDSADSVREDTPELVLVE
jgi:Carboxypeptidase regulatory-like domain